MKDITILVNQHSGKEEKEQIVDSILEYFKENTDITVTVLYPETAEKMQTFAKEACQNKVDMIIPLGGDGSISLVCAGIFEGGGHSRLGLIPTGTVNNFAKSLGIPLDLPSALDNLLKGHEVAFDLAQVNDRYMISSMTLGLMADIALGVTSENKRRFGFLAFLFAGWSIWWQQQSYKLFLDFNGQRLKYRTKILLLTMTNHIGGKEGFAPSERYDDGLFTVYILKKLHLIRFMWFYFVRKGEFKDYRHWDQFRTSQLEIHNRSKNKHHNPVTRIDGDTASTLPVTVTMHEKAIRTMVPTTA
ncbi:YegS/Rv2252/BmrU family lipid kinase [Streptococcus gallinaceus]|uniref:diacylglycerol/lipid kinase family protein n=1 Tax=Streptococcus gallinaceus TaxID=165758 RepID=UPI00209FB684|nr:diacylglycerol kinase family protein [Streptococcus gallinaceus]MCP1639995.1 YegS/Rv2252/BmrU family lipid kinase [Streptococcus gallinaceus]MCP1770633.1 YegS/Rv2252/BmrU family lipid kinase [Streptococcus gallinaceus]